LSHLNVIHELAPVFRYLREAGHFSASFRGQRLEAMLTGESALNYVARWNTRFSGVFKNRCAILSSPWDRHVDIIVNTDLDNLIELLLRLADPLNSMWPRSTQPNAAELESRWSEQLVSVGLQVNRISSDSVGCKVGELHLVFWPQDNWLHTPRPSCDRLFIDDKGNIVESSQKVSHELLRGLFRASGRPDQIYREIRIAAQYNLDIANPKVIKSPQADTREVMRILGLAPKRGLSLLHQLGLYHHLFRHADDYDTIKGHIMRKPTDTLAMMYRRQTPGTILMDLRGLFSGDFIDTVIDKVRKLQHHRNVAAIPPVLLDGAELSPQEVKVATGCADVRLLLSLADVGIRRQELASKQQALAFTCYLAERLDTFSEVDLNKEQMIEALYLSVLPGFNLNKRVSDAHLRRRSL